MGIVNLTYKGQAPGLHQNSALPQNELDAAYFNEVENNIELLNDAVEALQDNQVNLLVDFVRSLDRAIQFDPDTANGPQGSSLVIPIKVTTSDGTLEPFTTVTSVTVEIQADTTGGATINGSTTPVVVPLTNGQGQVTVVDGGAPGSVDLGLVDSSSSGLDVTDVATASFTSSSI